jgi:hypothetical protein
LTTALANDDVAMAYLSYLRAETRSLVFSPGCRRLIEALLPELLEHSILDGARVEEIFANA